MKNELASVNLRTGEIFDPNTAKSALRVHGSESLMAAAKRARDPEKFSEAIHENFQAKRDFSAAYRAKYPHGDGPGRGHKEKRDASTGVSLSSADFCRSYGFALRTVQRWCELLLDDDDFKAEMEAAIHKIESLFLDMATGDTTGKKWTGDAESYTPDEYIKSARKVLGGIDLDPASNKLAQKVVKAKEYFTDAEDGTKQSWHGRVFLNPPYKYPLVATFIDKLCKEHESGNVPSAILLTNNNTDTKWWHQAATLARGVCFTAGRINFYKADGRETQPTNGQTFFYFGAGLPKFKEEFSRHGLVMMTNDN